MKDYTKDVVYEYKELPTTAKGTIGILLETDGGISFGTRAQSLQKYVYRCFFCKKDITKKMYRMYKEHDIFCDSEEELLCECGNVTAKVAVHKGMKTLHQFLPQNVTSKS